MSTESEANSQPGRNSNGPLALLIDDVHIEYDVWEDRRQGLLSRFAGGAADHTVVHAVKGVSFAVYEGESLAIVGSNGSGKSTILSAIAGLLPVTSGAIYSSAEPRLMGVGAALLPTVSGLHNIRIGCLALGMTQDEIDERMESIIAFADIGEAINRPLRSYSSGMKARLLFSIATAMQPRILMVDEALAVGDKAFRKRSEARINQMLDHAGTLIMVSHNMRELRRLCSRALWMEQGVLLADGPIEEVLDEYESDD